MRPLVPVVIEQNWRNFKSTSFDDVRALQFSTATSNVKSNSFCDVSERLPAKPLHRARRKLVFAVTNSSSSSLNDASAKLSPTCLQRERDFSRCGAKRKRKGENVFRYPSSARGRCVAKRSLPPTLLAPSSGLRRCDF